MVKKLSTRKLDKTSLHIYQDEDPQIRFGLCCINNKLREQKIYCSRTTIRRTYTVEKAKSLALQNLHDLKYMIKWNTKHHIHHYRMSSDMFPHINDPEVENYTIDDFKPLLYDIGKYCKKVNQRITFHPSQFNQIGANKQSVFESTLQDLQHHADILDAMHLNDESIICIHGGGTYGDKESTIERWISQFKTLPNSIKRRIAIENCELQYNIEDCIYIANKCDIPVIFDIHHFNCYNEKYNLNWNAEKYIPYVLDTWKERTPVFHISDQKKSAKLGAHHDFVKEIPDFFLNIPVLYKKSVDIEIEAKAKEAAIFKLYETHSELLNTIIKY